MISAWVKRAKNLSGERATNAGDSFSGRSCASRMKMRSEASASSKSVPAKQGAGFWMMAYIERGSDVEAGERAAEHAEDFVRTNQCF